MSLRPSLPPIFAADPSYPLGRFIRPETITRLGLEEALLQMGELPGELRMAVKGLTDWQQETPYREGGWMVRQVVNHVADSHMNSYIRMKLALTEDEPTIKPYDEKAWAALHDGEDAPMEWSLELVESLHARWLMMLRSLTAAQWQRAFVHPDDGRMTLEMAAMYYAWHGRHHVAHINALRAAKGW